MRPLLAVILLIGFAFIPLALAETVVVTESWVKLRGAPEPGAKAVGLVYGNDSYEVLDQEGEWYQVTIRGGQTGWLHGSTVYPVMEPIARKTLDFATDLRTTGRRRQARAKLFEVMRRFPETIHGYEATRQLLTYHPVGSLPVPEDGEVPIEAREQARKFASWLMVEEGRLLIEEARYDEAVSMFEEARTLGRLNLSAMDGIREALQRQLQEALQAGAMERIRVVTLALRDYFPEVRNRGSFKWFDPETGWRLDRYTSRSDVPVEPSAPSATVPVEMDVDPAATLETEIAAAVPQTALTVQMAGLPLEPPLVAPPKSQPAKSQPAIGPAATAADAAAVAMEPAAAVKESAAPSMEPAAPLREPMAPAIDPAAPLSEPPSFDPGPSLRAVKPIHFARVRQEELAQLAALTPLPPPPPAFGELAERPAPNLPGTGN